MSSRCRDNGCYGDGWQGDDYVVECYRDESKKDVFVRLSKNDGKQNKVVSLVRVFARARDGH